MSLPATAHPLLPQTVALLRDLVAFDTTSRYSNLAIIDYIENYLAEWEFSMFRISSDDGTKASLIARIGPESPGGTMLSGHTDVVPVDGQPWDTPPFTLTECDGLLYGRGTADMKGFLACCLAMAPTFAALTLKKPIYLAFSHDEEVGCKAAAPIATAMLARGWKPELAVVGEPTEMQVANAHKGIASFETVVTGHESHSSNPELGVNAIAYGVRFVQFLNELAAEYRARAVEDSPFFPAYTTLHVGVMNGGTARNIIPRECRILWEIRPLPNDKLEDITDRIQHFAGILNAEMQAAHADAGLQTYPISSVPGLVPYSDFPGPNMLHMAHANHTCAVGFATEAGFFQKNGIPAIVFGPGSITQAHKPNEFIAPVQLSLCLEFMERLAKQTQG